MDKAQHAQVTKDATINTYAYLWNASWSLLQQAKAFNSGSFYQIMGSLVFAAFTVEAYLNHVGKRIFRDWDDIEKRGPKKKISLICEQLRIQKDDAKRPYKTVVDLLKFRNDLAHGKSIVFNESQLKMMDANFETFLQQELKTQWQESCTLEAAEQAQEDVKVIIESIHVKSGMQGKAFDMGSSGYVSQPQALNQEP